jgi:arylsulfatase A-like enzyme
VDDLRWDELGCAGHPYVRTPHIDRLAKEGTMFNNAFATIPLCSPSRASILTGLYPHGNGIVDNIDRSEESHRLATFPQQLQKAGYETAFIGKWHMGNDSSPRPGFDHWVSLRGQGTSNDPEMNVNGETIFEKGYTTDLLTDRTVDYLRENHEQPFCLCLSHKAMHPETSQGPDGKLSDPNASNFVPAERHRDLYEGVSIPRRPNASSAGKGKPALSRSLEGVAPLSMETGSSDEVILGRQRMLTAVDDGLGEIYKVLEESKQLDNTLVVLTSDHGYFYGEHGLSVERRLAYEESIRIPLLMRCPGIVPAGETRDQMATAVDLAPTFMELAGAKIPDYLHGESLKACLDDCTVDGRDELLVEYYSDAVFDRIENMGYEAIRTADWKYIRYVELEGMDELYDLRNDPYEVSNLIDNPAAAAKLGDLKGRLRELVATTGGTVR